MLGYQNFLAASPGQSWLRRDRLRRRFQCHNRTATPIPTIATIAAQNAISRARFSYLFISQHLANSLRSHSS